MKALPNPYRYTETETETGDRDLDGDKTKTKTKRKTLDRYSGKRLALPEPRKGLRRKGRLLYRRGASQSLSPLRHAICCTQSLNELNSG